MCRRVQRLIAVAVVVSLPGIAIAQQPASGSEAAQVLDQLTEINLTLKRIADSLEGQLDGQRLDLMLKRLEVSERRVAALQEQVQKGQASRSLLEDQKARAELQLSEMADRLAAGKLELSDTEAETVVTQMELDLEQLSSRISELDRKIAGLENELTRAREEIRDWQDYVDRELAGR
jgi:chromosome segregation ATPase